MAKNNINYKYGALKRKFKEKNPEPGTFIRKSKSKLTKRKVAIMGMV